MERVEKNRQMKKLKTTNLVRAVVGLLFVSQLSIALAADVISLWGGARGSIILKSDGTVWTWGTGGFGKLGINAFTGRSLVPVEVHGATNIDYLHSVMAVMGCETHNLARVANPKFGPDRIRAAEACPDCHQRTRRGKAPFVGGCSSSLSACPSPSHETTWEAANWLESR